MAPAQDKTDRPYGLTDAEMKVSLCVLRLVVENKIAIDGVALAKLTGHEKHNTANKIWSMAKVKLASANAGSSETTTNDGAAAAAATTAAKKPAKRGRPGKAKAGGGKKVNIPVDDDDDDEEEEEHIDELELEQPAPKRSKKKVKQEAGDDSF